MRQHGILTRLAPDRVRHHAEAKAWMGAAIETLGYECPIIVCSPEELGGIES